jgi:K+-sensing histidine kinase KdpD
MASVFNSEIHIVHVYNDKKQAYIGTDAIKLWRQYYPKHLLKLKVGYSEDVDDYIYKYAVANDIKLISLCRSENRLFKNLFKMGLSDDLLKVSEIPLLILSKKNN